MHFRSSPLCVSEKIATGERRVDSPVSEAIHYKGIILRFSEVGLKRVSDNFPHFGHHRLSDPPTEAGGVTIVKTAKVCFVKFPDTWLFLLG